MTNRTIPAGWALTKLSDLTRHKSGNSKLIKGRLSSSPQDHLFPGYSASGQDVWVTEPEHDGPAIIVSAVGARCGKAFLADGQWSAIANTHIVWANEQAIDLRFLWYNLNDEQFWLRGGSAQPFVLVKDTLARPFLLPPLPEQHRIVVEIDKQFARIHAGINAIRHLQYQLERYRASVFKSACEGNLVRTEAEIARHQHRPYEPADHLLTRLVSSHRTSNVLRDTGLCKTKANRCGTIPEGWCWARFGELMQIRAGFAFSTKDYLPDANGVPLVRQSNLKGPFVSLDCAKYVPHRLYDRYKGSFGVHRGDILVGLSGSLSSVSVYQDESPALQNQRTGLLNVSTGMSRDFVLILYHTIIGEIERVAKGVAVQNVAPSQIENIIVSVPPLAEQQRIAERVASYLSIHANIEALAASQLSKSNRLRQSILNCAFDGKLVYHDLADEPASHPMDHVQAFDGQPVGRTARALRKQIRRHNAHTKRAAHEQDPESQETMRNSVTTPQQIVQKLWNFCSVLRDDGLSYNDYIEQLTFLLFLKMAHEQTVEPWNQPSTIPKGFDWPSLVTKDGDALEKQYRRTLEILGKSKGMLGVIFRKAQNKIQDPAKLHKLIADLIDREHWTSIDADVKGDAYEGLLEKNAQDTKGGAGQYFTPRSLIHAIVDVIVPKPGETVCDPACGTGGFLLAAHDYIAKQDTHLDEEQQRCLSFCAVRGWEIVDNTARLCAMNLLLHGIECEDCPVIVDDALRGDPGERFDLVLTNPPFGRKSSVTVVNERGEREKEALTIVRDDFWASTSNKQLNFVQHAKTLLTSNGRAAIVVPDNVLFEAGAGEVIRRKLLHECEVHTLLRLPPGIFYAQGVKANVLFFDKKPGREKPWTEHLWIYDLRTNKDFTLKTNPLKREDLDEFVACFKPGNRHHRKPTWSAEKPDGRWRSFTYDELMQRDKLSLDISWLRDDSLEDAASLPSPDVIAAEIVADLRAALAQFEAIERDISRR